MAKPVQVRHCPATVTGPPARSQVARLPAARKPSRSGVCVTDRLKHTFLQPWEGIFLERSEEDEPSCRPLGSPCAVARQPGPCPACAVGAHAHPAGCQGTGCPRSPCHRLRPERTNGHRHRSKAPRTPTATVAVAVQLDTGRHLVRLVDFVQPISGLQALVQSGLDATIADAGFGPAVCAIEGVGCPADDCFCNPDLFWNYSYWDGGAWQSYPVGAGRVDHLGAGGDRGLALGRVRGRPDGTGPDHRRRDGPALAPQPTGPGGGRLRWGRRQRRGSRPGPGRQCGDSGLLARRRRGPQPARFSAHPRHPVLAGKRGRRRQAGRGQCRRVRVPHRAQPDARSLPGRRVDRLRTRQRLQCLGHPGRSGAQRDRADHGRGGA